jgi:hypothetical protein
VRARVPNTLATDQLWLGSVLLLQEHMPNISSLAMLILSALRSRPMILEAFHFAIEKDTTFSPTGYLSSCSTIVVGKLATAVSDDSIQPTMRPLPWKEVGTLT